TGHPEVRSVAWPEWRGIGMVEEIRPEARLPSIEVEEGLAVLDSVIAGAMPATIIVSQPAGRKQDPPARPAGPGSEPHGPRPIPEWLLQVFSETTGIAPGDLDPTVAFGELGVESVAIAALVRKIEARLGRHLEPSALLEHPTLERLAFHLTQGPPGPMARDAGP